MWSSNSPHYINKAENNFSKGLRNSKNEAPRPQARGPETPSKRPRDPKQEAQRPQARGPETPSKKPRDPKQETPRPQARGPETPSKRPRDAKQEAPRPQARGLETPSKRPRGANITLVKWLTLYYVNRKTGETYHTQSGCIKIVIFIIKIKKNHLFDLNQIFLFTSE